MNCQHIAELEYSNKTTLFSQQIKPAKAEANKKLPSFLLNRNHEPVRPSSKALAWLSRWMVKSTLALLSHCKWWFMDIVQWLWPSKSGGREGGDCVCVCVCVWLIPVISLWPSALAKWGRRDRRKCRGEKRKKDGVGGWGGLTEVHLQPDSNELYKSTFSLENGDDHERGWGGGDPPPRGIKVV